MADTFKPIAVEGGKANQKVERKLLMTFVDVSFSGGGSPEWELQGRSVEDASVEYNHDASQTTDILGKVDTDVAAAMPQITMDPNTLRAGQKLNAKLVDIERRGATSELSTFKVLQVYAFLSDTGAGPFEADTYDNCTIVPQSLGGSSYVGMPFDLYLSGDRTAGTATITPGTGGGLATATFTPRRRGITGRG